MLRFFFLNLQKRVKSKISLRFRYWHFSYFMVIQIVFEAFSWPCVKLLYFLLFSCFLMNFSIILRSGRLFRNVWNWQLCQYIKSIFVTKIKNLKLDLFFMSILSLFLKVKCNLKLNNIKTVQKGEVFK